MVKCHGAIIVTSRGMDAYVSLFSIVIVCIAVIAVLFIENLWLYVKVRSARRIRNDFLNNISHEIRTPINAIMGFSEILDRPEVSANLRQSAVRNIKKNSRHLTRLIDDILDLSKVEAGKFPIGKEEIHFPSFLAEVESTVRAWALNKQLQFRVLKTTALPEIILTDQRRLRQILLNVLENAVKFTNVGEVELHLAARKKGRRAFLSFRVKDTGPGLTPSIRASLFEIFSPGDPSLSRKFGGLGLGLVLAKRMARKMGGDVSLVQTSSLGSVFQMSIACDLFENDSPWIAPVESPKKVAPVVAKKGANILLVEDSVDNQEVFEFFLRTAGHRVRIVDNGFEAVKLADEYVFDIILMDIQIPGISGKQATSQIRDHGFSKPIIALTAHALPEEVESCLQAGCSGQITKPVSGEELVAAVHTYLS